MAVWVSRCLSGALLFRANATAAFETVRIENYVRHCRVGETKCFCERHSQFSTQEPVRAASGSPTKRTHMRGETERERGGWLRLSLCSFKGAGERREREGKVPSCPGTEGSYKACSSSGPSRQAGWQGALLHSTCQREIPKAR